MPKLHIIIEGTEEEIDLIAGQLSDGGGEPALRPVEFEDARKHLNFDYAQCFPAWGYDPEKHGPDKTVTVRIVEES